MSIIDNADITIKDEGTYAVFDFKTEKARNWAHSIAPSIDTLTGPATNGFIKSFSVARVQAERLRKKLEETDLKVFDF